jgi:Domain of unknown function (DUF4157)
VTAFATPQQSELARSARDSARLAAAEAATHKDTPRAVHGHELDAVAATRGSPPERIEVGRTDDPLEREADSVAAHALSDERAVAHAKTCTCGGTCPACRRAAQAQRMPAPTTAATAETARVPPVVARPGEPLSAPDRAFFEPRLDADLSNVRVHADAAAAHSAETLGARAYVFGSDIVFGAGEYRPESPAGRRLLAHELAHVLQQRTRVQRQTVAPEDEPAAEGAQEPETAPEAEERAPEGADAESPVEADAEEEAAAVPQEAAPAPGDKAIEVQSRGPAAPAAPPPVCDPDRDLTWADFRGSPNRSRFGAKTVAPVRAVGPRGAQRFQARLDSRRSWVRRRYSAPTNRAATGCGGLVRGCERFFRRLRAGQTGEQHLDDTPDPHCPAGVVPSATPVATSRGDCASVLGAECDRAAGLESDRLLRHEQLHFSIACAIARKANAALDAGSSLATVRTAVNHVLQPTQNSYDTDSTHGCDAAGQSTWETDVAGGLTSVTIP